VGKKPLKFVQTSGGAFILLPLEQRKEWEGAKDDPDNPKTDYAKTRPFAGKLGTLKVGPGTALILGRPDETAFWALPDGGIFVQRAEGEDEEELHEAIEEAVAATDWSPSDVSFEVSDKGRLALMDSYDTYADTEKEDRIEVQLQPGKYTIQTRDMKDEEAELDLHLVRVKKA
jgi:hypothetical protein